MDKVELGMFFSPLRSPMSDFPYVITMANCVIGVSILAMPWSFLQVGIVFGTVLLLLGAVVTKFACYLLLSCLNQAYSSTAPHNYPASYEVLALNVLGRKGKFLVEFTTIGYLLGICVAFLVVIGDMTPPLLHDFLGLSEEQVPRSVLIVAVTLLVMLPLSLIQRIEKLQGLSTISIVLYVIFAIKLGWEALQSQSGERKGEVALWKLNDHFVTVLPIFLCGLSCQTQVFVMHDSLGKGSSGSRLYEIISDAINICFVLYWFIGCCGYIAFGDKTDGDVLVNFDATLSSNIVELFYVITVMISFPLCIFPCRRSVETLIFYEDPVGVTDSSSLVAHERKSTIWNPSEDYRFTIITLGLVFVVCTVALVIPNVQTVLNFCGSTMGATVCFFLPAAIALKVHQQAGPGLRIMCWTNILVGTLVCASGFSEIATFVGAAKHVPDGTVKVPSKHEEPEPMRDLRGAMEP